MATIKYIGTNTEGLYNDGDQVENDILEYVKTTPQSAYRTIYQKDHRWPVFYHLSDMREDILNWYDFNPNSAILEIGGGMGALTGLLCRKAKSVTTVELTKRRAEIIYARHAQCENLTILVGNFNEIEFTEKYDYITLIGVLEYAKGFTETGRAEDFLEKIKGLLKPGGKVLLGIENRFGMKYWCGAHEDHVNKPYVGINGYPGIQNIQTYSRHELTELLKKSGLEKYRFYYPMPDYKFSQIMYSDDFLPKSRFSNKIVQYYLNDPQLIADEAKMLEAAIQNNSFPFLANSFFVECGGDEAELSDITFASFTPGRSPVYSVITLIRKDGSVEKTAAFPEAADHLNAILENQQKFASDQLAPYRKAGDRLQMDFIKGNTLETVLRECLKERKLVEVKKWLDLLYESIKRSAKAEEAGDDPVLQYGFLDMTPSNCFIRENKLIFFDQEWIAEKVHASFVLYRAIRTFYMENTDIEQEIPLKAVLALFFSDPKILAAYEQQEHKFLISIEPPNRHPMAPLFHNHVPVDPDVFSRAKQKLYTASFYFDLGNGYSEETKYSVSFDPEKPFRNTIPIPAGTVSVRFDPVDGHFCIVNDLSVVSEGERLSFQCLNGKERKGLMLFETMDSQIEIKLCSPVSYIIIQANIACFDSTEMLSVFGKYFESETNYEMLKAQLSQEISVLNQQIDQLEQDNAEKDRYIGEIVALCDDRLTQIQSLQSANHELSNRCRYAEESYLIVSNSFFWKVTKPARAALDNIKKVARKNEHVYLALQTAKWTLHYGPKAAYRRRKLAKAEQSRRHAAARWPSAEELEQQKKTKFSRNIKFSILVPLYNTPEQFLKEMIESVQNQSYQNWELCLADGSDGEHANVGAISKKFARKDKRIKYKKLEKNMGISENTNACIEMATGNYIALFDHDDILHPSALYEVMKAICEKDADFIYTDENTFHDTPKDAFNPHFKPDFAPDNLRANNYICHLTVFDRALLKKIGGGFRPECDGSQDFDMVLRLTEKAKHIVHVPQILYYWRAHQGSVAEAVTAKPYVIDAAKKAISDHLKRVGLEGEVLDSVVPSMYRLKYTIKGQPLVSILIPNMDHLDDLSRCVESILKKSTYRHFEIIIIENNSKEKETFKYYKELSRKETRVRIITWKGPFNYSAINNFGFKQSKGKHIILLNNDTEIISPDWIQEMLMYSQRKDVGAVGAKLYYPDHTIQHAGIGIGLLTLAGHYHKHFDGNHPGYMGRLIYAQDVSAVTAACVMIPRHVFEEISGLDETFEVAFNDVDMCMRIRKRNYLIVFTPFAELYHYESKSRGSDEAPKKRKRFIGEVERFQKRWTKELEAGDPYYNPNLTLDREDFGVK